MFDLLANVLFSFPISHAAAITIEILIVLLVLLLVVVVLILLATEALVNQVQEDPLGEVAEFAERRQVRALSSHCEFKESFHFPKEIPCCANRFKIPRRKLVVLVETVHFKDLAPQL